MANRLAGSASPYLEPHKGWDPQAFEEAGNGPAAPMYGRSLL